MTLAMRLKGLYAITDNHLTPSVQLLSKVEQALRGGVTILQYRDKTDDHDRRHKEALALQALCKKYQCTFIINDDVSLCKNVNADGVHLGLTDSEITYAREQLGPSAIIGATCHGSIELAQQAVLAGADYVAFGRFFTSNSKPGAPAADLNSLREGLSQLTVPSVAIGGITLNKADELLDAGFSMLAVIEDIFKPATITAQCKAYCDVFERHFQPANPDKLL